ncbi:cell envelope integrity protein CreD [Dysgonomonas sp. GY617]|uniref:cell envelope integrity protein CreD n=1 Tax=Dysgonomonas sp. GY617 TaxID=2780420 RepID=UPI001883A44B|nr:cell envelope integrity protein CreD [Dysgonomonas sp. GY617]MBF0574962.1 cell envelope integrity protein CreD [Dysgonomonas sp. GY617]
METTKNFFKNQALTTKIVIVVILTLLMLIPIGMVRSLITEREDNKVAEQTEMSDRWGGRQLLTGPVLVLPYKQSLAVGSAAPSFVYCLPEEYNVTGDIKPEERTRGIQKILSYQSTMHFEGKFIFPDYKSLDLNEALIQWDEAYIVMGISNLQGVKNKIMFNINGHPQEILANVADNDLIRSGVMIRMPLAAADMGKSYNFDFDLVLNGTDGLHFLPVGKQTNVHLNSTWKSVAYTGDYVPTEKADVKEGIDAQWNIFDYNRSYTQMWVGKNDSFGSTKLGLDLLLPIDHYQKTMRAVKYAIMFIALTFLVFFMVEILSKKRIHPVQYLLVSFALVLFYSLLLALSEHIGFDWSYLVSALAIVMLITAYSHSIFKSRKQTLFMGLFLSALYIFLYVVIQLEDMALLLGSIGLFVALAIVMFVSRNINWYKDDERIDKSLD